MLLDLCSEFDIIVSKEDDSDFWWFQSSLTCKQSMCVYVYAREGENKMTKLKQ